MLKTFSHNTMFDIRLLCPARIKENSNAIMIFPNHEIVFSYLRSFSMTSRTFSSSKLYSFPNAFNVLLRSNLPIEGRIGSTAVDRFFDRVHISEFELKNVVAAILLVPSALDRYIASQYPSGTGSVTISLGKSFDKRD